MYNLGEGKQMIKSELKILLISSNLEDVQKVQGALNAWDTAMISLEIAKTPEEGMCRILKGDLDILLLDMSIAKITGFEALDAFRTRSITLPVLVLIESDDEEVGLTAINHGAQDYLCKENINVYSLRQSIRYAMERCKMAEELKLANRAALEQQESVIELDKLKSLLAQSGETAHELNQPLTVLLGSLCLMKLDQENPEKLSRHLELIEDAGKRISVSVKKIQAIRYDKYKRYLGGASVIKPDQNVRLNNIEAPDNNFKNLNNLFRIVQSRFNGNAA
jgi:two-component system cell cycle response regulator